jgi:hypothetical protein
MSEVCRCNMCVRRFGTPQVVARSTWYTHNPGGKKATRLAERQSRIDAIRHDNDLSRDNSGSGTSPLLGKRPAEEGEDPPEGAKRVARSGSVRIYP